jgi:general secretion pathway protein D
MSAPGPGGGGGTGVNPISQSLFEGSIKISPDKSTNALVITASPSDFVTVQRVINKLDIPRDQVYVEVAIMEVGIGSQFAYSANFITTSPQAGLITNGADLSNVLTGNFASATGALIPLPFGNPSTLKIAGVDTPVPFSAFGLVRALQGNSNTNILATPQIIALDNTEATFESSEKIPIATNTVTATGLSQQSATKEPVVLSIKIKPQINKITNFVKMDVTTKLGNVDNTNTPPQLKNISFGSTERTAQTSVVVGDTDTVVLGGLVRDRNEITENKVPLLGDIPILGWLFKSKTTLVAKTNLLIFMTPHIVRQYEKVRAILDRKLKERDEYIETSAGGVDPMRVQRDNIIRSLPDMKDLVQKKTQRYYTQDEEAPAAVAVEPEEKKSNSSSPSSATQKNNTGQGQPVFNPEERAPLPITPEAPMNPPPANPAPAGTEGNTSIPPGGASIPNSVNPEGDIPPPPTAGP